MLKYNVTENLKFFVKLFLPKQGLGGAWSAGRCGEMIRWHDTCTRDDRAAWAPRRPGAPVITRAGQAGSGRFSPSLEIRLRLGCASVYQSPVSNSAAAVSVCTR